MRHAASSAVALATLAIAGCGEEPASFRGGAVPDVSVVERGPVTLTFRAAPGEVLAGDTVELTIDVVAEAGVEIEMPVFDERVGSFLVASSSTPPDVPEGGRRRWIHTYELDSFDAGQQDIPAVTVKFADRRPEADGGTTIEGELMSDPLVVTVRTVLLEGETVDTMRPLKPQEVVPGEMSRTGLWFIGGIIAGLGLLGGVLLALLSRRGTKLTAAPKPIPPHEWALAELDRLEADDLVSAGDFHDFYFRLSAIIREYIERRFGLMAPERTTEEFLREAGRSPVLTDEHRDLLAGFLRAADMVKFARHVPTPADADAAMGAARGFVSDTGPSAGPVGPATVETAA